MRTHLVLIGLWLALGGCSAPTGAPPGYLAMPKSTTAILPNPLSVTANNPEFVFDQVVDVIDDYFRIERQERPRQLGELATEGRIETFPETAATILEPWRADSVTPYERWESTLQSMRRRATVRLLPGQGGYFVEVVVVKELEDVRVPDKFTATGLIVHSETSPNRLVEGTVARPAPTSWFPVRRDAPLEQEILSQIQMRLQTRAPLAPLAPSPVFPAPVVPETVPTPPPSATLTPVSPR